MKKIVSLVLAISMVLSMFVSAFAATASFEDVANTKYAGSVEALVELGVINGLPDGTYGPEKEVTRAELAKMLVICLGLGDTVESLAGRTIFTDVAENHWASGYINAAVQTKVIAGYPDGTFKPEKEVSYAEAVTMVIRALGYGNVVDTEGTWPTAYMLKAVELELLNDMGSPKAGEAALRGNVAILLWNMLRTPMWKITSENEGTGMTSTADALMLNVKFPSYRYVEDVKVAGVSIDDETKVTVELLLGYTVDNDAVTVSGKVVDVDLPRVLVGMTVSSLIKNYKDAEEAEILTLTPKYALVEGLITDDVTTEKVEIEDVEYKIVDLGEASGDELISGDSYVVAEVNGKKVTAMKKLPVAPTEEVEKLKAMENDIDEEDLVIIDGVWSTRKDIKVGDVWTKLTTDDGSEYFMVARERVKGSFESLTREKDDDRRVYFEVDGEEYRAFEGKVEVFEGEENDQKVDLDELEVKEKDNKYLDQDVELVLNYLGQVITVYFGEVSDLEAAGDFYVVMSNGVWTSSTSTGTQYHIVLAGVDGEEESYDFTKNGEYTSPELEENAVYASGEPRFVWANIDDNGLVKKVVLLKDGLVSGEEYKGDYAFVAFSGEIEENYLAKSGDATTKYKVGASTIVMTATPIEDEDEKVIGFEVEVTEGPEALEGVTEGLIAYDVENPVRAKYVFVTEDAKSQDLLFGKVEKVRQSRGVVYATISGTEYAVDLEECSGDYNTFALIEDLDKDLVAFTENNDKIVIKNHVVPADMDGMAWVEEVDDELVTISGDATFAGTYDVESKEDKEKFEDYTFVLVSAYEDKEGYVAFDSDVENLGKGLENASMKKGDRLTIDTDLKVVVIVNGFDVEDSFSNGEINYGK